MMIIMSIFHLEYERDELTVLAGDNDDSNDDDNVYDDIHDNNDNNHLE